MNTFQQRIPAWMGYVTWHSVVLLKFWSVYCLKTPLAVVSCADFIRCVEDDFVRTREVKRISLRPPRPPSPPLVDVNTIIMQKVWIYEELELSCEHAGKHPVRYSCTWSWRIMACSHIHKESWRMESLLRSTQNYFSLNIHWYPLLGSRYTWSSIMHS